MDVKLHNAYVEVVLDNFLSVVKQNLMFQAQLQVANDYTKEIETLRNQLEDLKKRNIELQVKLNDTEHSNVNLKKSFDENNLQKDSIENLKKEKERIQSALNDSLKENKKLKSELEEKNSIIESRDKYIENLQSSSSTRLKKIKSVDISQTSSSDDKIEVKSGGVF